MPPISGWLRVAIIPTRVTRQWSQRALIAWRGFVEERVVERRVSPHPGALGAQRAEHPQPVGDGVQVGPTVEPLPLDARDLGDGQPGAGEPAVDQGLDLETV